VKQYIDEVDTDNWGLAGISVTKYRAQEHGTAGKACPRFLVIVWPAQVSVLRKRNKQAWKKCLRQIPKKQLVRIVSSAIMGPWSFQTLWPQVFSLSSVSPVLRN
jgi:hypothetical protein